MDSINGCNFQFCFQPLIYFPTFNAHASNFEQVGRLSDSKLSDFLSLSYSLLVAQLVAAKNSLQNMFPSPIVSMKVHFIFKREIFPLDLGLLWNCFEIGNVAQHHRTVCLKVFISVFFGTIALPFCKVFKGRDKRRKKN